MTETYLTPFLEQNVRPDGRTLNACRKTSLVTGIVTNEMCLGSALCKLGNTQVLTTINFAVGQPSPTAPKEGQIEVNAHFGSSALSHTNKEMVALLLSSHNTNQSTSIRDKEDQIQSHISKLLLQVIDIKELGIEQNVAAFKLIVSITILNNDGNVLDCSAISAVGAMKGVAVPVVTKEEEDEQYKLVRNKYRSLSTARSVSQLTFGLVDDSKEDKVVSMVDCTALEEHVLESYITIAVAIDDETSEETLLFVNKYGKGVPISVEDMKIFSTIASARVKEIQGLLIN